MGLAHAVVTPPVPFLPQENHLVLVVGYPLRDAHLPTIPRFHAFEGSPVLLAIRVRTEEREVREVLETIGVGLSLIHI